MEHVLRWLLSPLAAIYALITIGRKSFYDIGLLKSTSFDVPVISIGNLSVGGTGKTPHTEYLIQILRPYLNVATLSRGYGRKTTGFKVVQPQSTSKEVGDEPLQIKLKYPDVLVTVGEQRVFAIPKLMSIPPPSQVILLDDAFQHLAVNPGLNILLTTYARPYWDDYLLPMGRLREMPEGAKRADIIIVTKCPEDLSLAAAQLIKTKIAPLSHQVVYFTTISYGKPYYYFNPQQRLDLSKDLSLFLISGIADDTPLKEYLARQSNRVYQSKYGDHHEFSNAEIGRINTGYNDLSTTQKVMITTEKDAVRMHSHRDYIQEHRWPLFIMPIQVRFLFDEGPAFDQQIKNWLLDFKV